jgi:hypothetical protein
MLLFEQLNRIADIELASRDSSEAMSEAASENGSV